MYSCYVRDSGNISFLGGTETEKIVFKWKILANISFLGVLTTWHD